MGEATLVSGINVARLSITEKRATVASLYRQELI